VAGYLHGDSLGNASHNHVAGICATKIAIPTLCIALLAGKFLLKDIQLIANR
jgi:hypothetical protein